MPIIFERTAARAVWDAASETPAPTADCRKLLRSKSESDTFVLTAFHKQQSLCGSRIPDAVLKYIIGHVAYKWNSPTGFAIFSSRRAQDASCPRKGPRPPAALRIHFQLTLFRLSCG